jgi:hypothetical protein
MSIMSIIERSYVQTAVYWGSPIPDGYGGHTFANPIEVDCRWEDKEQFLGSQVGGEVTGGLLLSRSIVFVKQDMDEEGYLYFGTLDDLDLDSNDYIDPKEVDKAYIIKRFEKTPAFGSTTEFLRKAFLTPFLR